MKQERGQQEWKEKILRKWKSVVGRMWDKGGKSERAEREQGELTKLFAYLDVPVAEMEIADIFHLFCVFPL